jgi:hypothetical protein
LPINMNSLSNTAVSLHPWQFLHYLCFPEYEVDLFYRMSEKQGAERSLWRKLPGECSDVFSPVSMAFVN